MHKCAVGCVLCVVRWFVLLLWQVKLLCVGAWCGGVVLCQKCVCVLWLEVASCVWPGVCSEWLQVVSGRVLCGGGMCMCGSVSGGGLFRIKVYIP